jgi:hypothetical protein
VNRHPERLIRQLHARPRNAEVDALKKEFEALNEIVRERGGWLTSVPGDPDIRLEALPGSTPPRDLRAIGYEVTEIGQTQRILPHAVTQKFETSSSGALVPVTEHSTRPVSVQVTNAGIATVEQFDLTTP